jgi:hypothetical protein
MAKRIKLKVQRNRLPDVDILWPVKEHEDHQQCTVAKLIADVHQAIPLESGDWSLDQYVCEVGGYECLHYAFVSDIIKDGDAVTIRPLGTPDVKARRLGGRTQITGEGFHILDGVPYGMQPNQRPMRPSVLIPSRKRRRPQLDEEDYGVDEAITVAEIEDDEELLAHVNGGNRANLLASEVEEGDEPPRKKQRGGGHVKFVTVRDIPDFTIEEAGEDEDEEDDGDFDPEGAAGSSDEEESEHGEDAATKSNDEDDSSDSDSSSEDSSTSEEDSSSSDESEVNEASTPEVMSAKPPSNAPKMNGVHKSDRPFASVGATLSNGTSLELHNNIPYNGKASTKDRNKRRRIRNKLISRARDNLGYGASVEECQVYLERHPELTEEVKRSMNIALGASTDKVEAPYADEDFIGLSEEIEGNGDSTLVTEATTNGDEVTKSPNDTVPSASIDHEMLGSVTNKSTDLARRRQDLFDAIAAGGVLNTSKEEPVSILEAEKRASTHTPAKRSSPAAASAESKRVRLNIDGSRRAIFSALGQRTPKTQQDNERVRARLAGVGQKQKFGPAPTVTKPSATESAEEPKEEDPLSDAWRSKIRLMAVDCDNPEVKLSEPPYPFKQRWDVSQQRDKNWWAQGGKAKKRKARNSYGQDFGKEEEEDVSYLEYGEQEYGEQEYVEIEEQYLDGGDGVEEYADVKEDSAEFVEDLPSMPADLSTLKELRQDDLVPGAIIAFKQLKCSQATNWTPIMSAHRTAKITKTLESDLVEVELAVRDRHVKDVKYDAEGKRVYEKFEMDAGNSDEEEVDDGIREIKLTEVIEPKLLKSAEEALEDSVDAIVDAVANDQIV